MRFARIAVKAGRYENNERDLIIASFAIKKGSRNRFKCGLSAL